MPGLACLVLSTLTQYKGWSQAHSLRERERERDSPDIPAMNGVGTLTH